MTQFGNHYRSTTHIDQRSEVKSFFTELLACPCVTESETSDVFKFDNDVFFGMYYTRKPEELLTREQFMNATWCEIKSNNVNALTNRLREAGITSFDYSDKEHFYFQAPWGQMFRIAEA